MLEEYFGLVIVKCGCIFVGFIIEGECIFSSVCCMLYEYELLE